MFNIIVNNGSASKKYSLYREKDFLFSIHYEKVADDFVKTEKTKTDSGEEKIDLKIFTKGFDDFIDEIISRKLIIDESDINNIGIRLVAPGKFFQEHKKIDQNFLEKLEDKKHSSPLHIDPVQKEISQILDRFSGVDIYSISDSAFHINKPDYANIYAYPKEITEKLELYRFGFHGLSVSSVVNKMLSEDSLPENLIVCHLGGGSSITAVKNGKSIDNSMGYSPLEGIPMATRIGNADPNSLFAIMKEYDFDPDEMQKMLYKECGFKGISNISSDTRVILKEAQNNNKDAILTLDYYAYEIKKIIGSYKIIMGGLDAIVFTGTIGNRSADVRARICNGLEESDIIIDHSKNKLTINSEGQISEEGSKTKILVLETEEMNEMNNILLSF